MAKDSFFKRLACHFKPTHNEPQQDEPQGDNQPSPNIVVEIPESTRTAIEKLQNVPLAIEDLREAISRQTSACEKLRSLNQPDARVSELLVKIRDQGDRQAQTLERIFDELTRRPDIDTRIASSINSLSESMTNVSRGNQAHVELIEQLRDRLASSRDDTLEQLTSHARRLEKLLIAIIAMLALVIVAAIISIA